MTPAEALRYEHPTLLRVARHLLDQREAGLPAMVARGKLGQADADLRLATARAIVAIWEAVTAPHDLPHDFPHDVTWGALRRDLADVAPRAAASPPKGAGPDYAAALAAIAWHLQPIAGARHDCPHIVCVHAFNQRLRAERAVSHARAA